MKLPFLPLLGLLAVGCASPQSGDTPSDPDSMLVIEDAQETKIDPPSMGEMMVMGLPSDEHQWLSKMEGTFDQTYTMFMTPGAEPMSFKGVTKNQMTLGGRWLEVKAESTFMMTKSQSIGYLGFDRRNHVYTTYGMDTASTYAVSASGTLDDSGVLQLHGVDHEPWGPQIYTFEIEVVSDDEYHVRVLFKEMGGKVYDEPFLMVEVKNTRRAEADAAN